MLKATTLDVLLFTRLDVLCTLYFALCTMRDALWSIVPGYPSLSLYRQALVDI
ncbi:MAG: hypothetical protein ACRCXH_09915 [Shewanella sp.]